MSELFDKLKRAVNIEEVVERFYTKPKDHFVICPFHTEKTGSLSLNPEGNYFTCFGCGEKGDMIHFVALLKNISEYDAAVLIAESFGLSDIVSAGTKRFDKISAGVKKPPRDGFVAPVTQIKKQAEDVVTVSADAKARHSKFIRACTERVKIKINYLKSRGFTDDIIAKFRLGYDPVKDGIVIPYPPEFEYQITRLFNPPNPKKPYDKPYKKEWGPEPLFNVQALDGDGVVFVVESQLCAISIMQCGGVAVALGGLNGASLFLREVKAHNSKCIFVVALDNDIHGIPAQAKLVEKLKNLGARFIEYGVSGECKDPNELLQKDPDTLTANIIAAMAAAENAPQPEPVQEPIQETKTAAAEPKDDKVKALLEQEITDLAALFSEEYIAALAHAKEHMFADYSRFKIKAKAAKAPLRDIENSIAQYQKKKRQQAETGERPLDLGRDLGGAVAPKNWIVTLENGVRKIISTRDGEHEVIACPDAVVITARLSNADDGKQRIELSFYKDGAWKKVIGMRTQVYNKASIITFGDDGLHITSESAKDLVAYLSEYEIINKAIIPLKKSIARVGWISASGFFPFSTEEEVIFEDGGGSDIFYNLREHGDYAVWKEMMAKLRKNPFARFITSASFASPLLTKMGVRPFTIHIWHNSASGKSAALKAAVSVWGDPDKVMVTGYATMVGLEQKAGTLNNLPLAIDEKQAADENKTPFPRLIYMLGEGEGKTRGARSGGNQAKVTWHNVVVITGEEPITDNSTKDGVQTRTLELNGRPVDDIDFAGDVHRISENNFGYAGAAFIKAICKRLKAEPSFLVDKYNAVREAMKTKGMKGVHSEYIAAVVAADALMESIIFGTDEQTAESEAAKNGEYIFNHNEQQLRCDNVESAYSFMVSWIASNQSRFADNNSNNSFATPCYGKKGEDSEYKSTFNVVPIYLEEAFKEAGYNVEKIISGFVEKGYLRLYTDANGKKRRKHQVLLNGVRTDMYRFELIKKERPPRQISINDLKPIENDGENPF